MSDGSHTPDPIFEAPPSPPTTVKATKTAAKPKATGTGEKSSGFQAMLTHIAFCSASGVDWDKCAIIGNYKGARSAHVSYNAQRKKYIESLGSDAGGDKNAGSTEDAPLQAKKRKATKTADGDAGPKKSRKIKTAKEEDVDSD